MYRIRYSMLIMAIFMALTISALNVAPVLADESTPTAEPTSSEEVVVETEATPNPEEEATPLDVSEVDSVTDEESTTVAEVIESLPEDTTLVVLDENGEALPLVSEEAAEVIEMADPQWCPVGVTPNSVSCSGQFFNFNGAGGLIEWLEANNPNKAGVIWIDRYYTGTVGLEGGQIVLDGDNYGTMKNFALTINGGWIGGSTTTIDANDLSQFNVPFQIINWNNAITINNIEILGANGVGISALEVINTPSNITLNNVHVSGNSTENGGAYLNNTNGTGNVTVNNSTFNHNNGGSAIGLDISSKGIVTLKNVTANANTAVGVYIENQTSALPKAVTLNGSNQANYNGAGVVIYSKGVITLNNITAMYNAAYGALLDNCSYDYGNFDCDYGVASGVTIKGTNHFSSNGWDGLRVWSGGAISVSNITANDNGDPGRPGGSVAPNNFDATGKGVFLFNYGASTPKNIVISGTNVFKFNASTGLYADSYGMITVNNLTANFNSCDVFSEINTDFCGGAYLIAGGGVTQTGFGIFENNAENGLSVNAYNKGVITLNNLYAHENEIIGVEINAGGYLPQTAINVTINGSNIFNNNFGSGLYIDTDGTVTLNNLLAYANGSYGVYVNNAYLTKPVTLKGNNTFNGNTETGLLIRSYGAITTNSITAIGNTNGNGALLDNCNANAGICDTPTVKSIIMNGNNYFEENGNLGSNTGLLISSRGAITITNLTSIDNGHDGVNINNAENNAFGAVTIKGFAFVSNNDENGIRIIANGTVTLMNVTANGNGSHGADINNDISFINPVILNGNNFFNDNLAGLAIDSWGAIKVNNVIANDNNDLGIILLNYFSPNNQPITITGYGTFNNNSNGSGLYIWSAGHVTLANITANNNLHNGAFIQADNTNSDTLVANLTITGFGTFNGNNQEGLRVFTDGAITLSNITANNNYLTGALLNNSASYVSGPVRNITLNGINSFNQNRLGGLEIHASGNVTLTRVTANDHDDLVAGNPRSFGVKVISTGGNITFNCGSMYYNEGSGYDLSAGTGKVITLKGVFTFGNGLTNPVNITPIITRACPLP